MTTNQRLIELVNEKIESLIAAEKPLEILDWIKVRRELEQTWTIKWDKPFIWPPNDTGTLPWMPGDGITYTTNFSLTSPSGELYLSCCN